MSKYEPLSQFLRSRQAATTRLGFADIEKILGFNLPSSAHKYEAWWSNNELGHSHARAWIEAGWRTENVDLANRKVAFRRKAAQPTSVAARRGPPKTDPWGCMAGTVTIAPGTDLTAPSGEDWNAERGALLNE